MCGIAGWYAWGRDRLSRAEISKLWLENEFRGREAAGVAFIDDSKVWYIKSPGPAHALAQSIKPDHWGKIVESKWGLLHTRAATQGSPSNNDNNHPVGAFEWLVVHNGNVSNDELLFKHFNVKRPAEVDTVAINLLLAQGTDLESSLAHACTLRGSASVAAVCLKRPHDLVLFRLQGADVNLYWLPTKKILVWSSDKDGVGAVENYLSGFGGLPQIYQLPDQTAFLMTPEALKRYTLRPNPYGPAWGTSFFPRAAYSTGTSTAASIRPDPPNIPTGKVVMKSTVGMLEEPVFQQPQALHYLKRTEASVQPGKSLVVPTGLGRWVLTNTDEAVLREFRPHRRVKKRWEEFSEPGAPYVVALPASPAQQQDLDELLHFGTAEVGIEGRTVPAWMCPWCGVLKHPRAWELLEYQCDWCLVTSKPPVSL